MNSPSIRSILPAFVIAVSLYGCEKANEDSRSSKSAPGVAAPQQMHSAQGTVNNIDRDKGTVNISHGPVSSLNWPAMTMGFQAKDKNMLAELKQGDRVEFSFKEEPKGQYVITRIEPAK
jgi:Cu/Ag efflux protein CusF